ncbi:Maleylacetoacetate isomerase-like protein [Aphelenchoides fujianensis]|nr:Maleylacetoacetate isomerase-like protein [Aphelenchoides fujianensis]
MAIIEYLDEVFAPNPLLVEGSPVQKALVRSMALIIIADIQPLQNTPVLEYYAGEDRQKQNEWAAHWIERGMRALETKMQQTAGRYAVGDQITLVDVCIPSQVFNAHRYGLDMSQFPTIQRVNDELNKLEAVQRADAKNQPDAPR